MSEQMDPGAYAKMHQKAFRTACDFLAGHFPPGDDDEWWLQTAKDCSAASVLAGENILVMELLTAIMNYLGDEYKRRYQDGKADN